MTTTSATSTVHEQRGPTTRLFSDTASVLSVIKRILWLGRLVGISPVFIEEQNGEYSLKISSKAVTYSYFASFLSISTQAVLIGHMFMSTKDIHSFLYLNTRLGITSMIHFRRHQVVQILEHLQNLGVSIPTYYIAFPTIIYCGTFCVSFVTPIVMNLDFGQAVQSLIIDIGPQIVDVYSSFIYFCQMAVLKEAIIKLNEVLLKFKNSSEPSSMRPIMKQHIWLRQLCSFMNETYGVPMLLSGTAACIEVTFCLFTSLSFATEWTPVAWILSVWVALHLIPAVGVMAICQNVENEQRKITTISIQSSIDPSTASTDVLEQVREWDLQLRQLPIKFTAKGFFDLNSTQLKTIISTVITYTVILIQNSNRSGLSYAQNKAIIYN